MPIALIDRLRNAALKPVHAKGHAMTNKPRIAHLAGPMATIQNTPPLVTSNKARTKFGLNPRANPDGSRAKYDVLRAQRVAAPAKIYVEQFSSHPLEADSAQLYGPPDGYVDSAGNFSKDRKSDAHKAVYEIEIEPDDGLYPLPYMARKADGTAWEEECAVPGGPDDEARQGFYPDGSRSFEEIDRLNIGVDGLGNQISAVAEIDFYRVMPPGGFRKGLPAALRKDSGEGDIPSETRGRDFFPYKPFHLSAAPPRPSLARATNMVQSILAGGKYDGAIWTEGSPTNEETIYWLNLLIDTTLPICGNSAQRPQGQVSADGPKNIIDSVDYIASRVWADAEGRNRAGAVLIQEQRIFAARNVQKADARPGGYVATGGHGGILGASGHDGRPLLHYLPTAKHTYLSDVNLTRLPKEVPGLRRDGPKIATVTVPIKDGDGGLMDNAIPKVAIVKDASYWGGDYDDDIEREVDILAMLDHMLETAPLSGFVIEGLTPYGAITSLPRSRLMQKAVYSGIPVARVGRGNPEGFIPTSDPTYIGGSNLTATKARILLMAAIMKFGMLPPAADPDRPTSGELGAIFAKVKEYQSVFDTH
jgi:L-asparaginase